MLLLQVLVLCFAVFLGSWTPSSFNIGYSSGSVAMDGMSLFNNPRLLQPGIKMGPSIQDAKVDQYSTPASKYVCDLFLLNSVHAVDWRREEG